ncbi:MAG: DUF3298 and DUF4163 domain-containing protein [Methanoregulaceae archaeon]|nr:DUF3298 and DUF4163 domain-containing protein [Methanoregulaceae archaeon]
MPLTSAIALTLLIGQVNPDVRVYKKGKIEAEMKLGRVPGSSALANLARNTVRRAETKDYDEFMKQAREVERDFGYDWPGCSFESSSKVAFQDARAISIVVDCYQYLGGAHGLGVTRTYNFGLVQGKPKVLSLKDVVGAGNVEKVQILLIEKIVKHPRTAWKDMGWLTELSEQQLNRFWVNKKGLTWEFDPYELASYAVGPFTFSLSWAEMKGLISKTSPLGHLAR